MAVRCCLIPVDVLVIGGVEVDAVEAVELGGLGVITAVFVVVVVVVLLACLGGCVGLPSATWGRREPPIRTWVAFSASCCAVGGVSFEFGREASVELVSVGGVVGVALLAWPGCGIWTLSGDEGPSGNWLGFVAFDRFAPKVSSTAISAVVLVAVLVLALVAMGVSVGSPLPLSAACAAFNGFFLLWNLSGCFATRTL
jgi:hypothetical protein